MIRVYLSIFLASLNLISCGLVWYLHGLEAGSLAAFISASSAAWAVVVFMPPPEWFARGKDIE